MNLITQEQVNGSDYYTAVARGIEYTAHMIGEQWFVASRRLALGRRHIGGGKYYATLADVAANCKAFAGLDVLVGAQEVAA
jgi:hypothetical protein